MLALLAVLAIMRLLKAPGYFAMIIEIVLLLLFGIAWLVKGQAFPFLNDKTE
jgi:isoprenylcysteine carboxyl methyltransferase (ICMT) family protein YpbQ